MDWLQYVLLIIALIAMWRDNQSIKVDMLKESKEFHGRLCVLEQRYLQMMERFMESKK